MDPHLECVPCDWHSDVFCRLNQDQHGLSLVIIPSTGEEYQMIMTRSDGESTNNVCDGLRCQGTAPQAKPPPPLLSPSPFSLRPLPPPHLPRHLFLSSFQSLTFSKILSLCSAFSAFEQSSQCEGPLRSIPRSKCPLRRSWNPSLLPAPWIGVLCTLPVPRPPSWAHWFP